MPSTDRHGRPLIVAADWFGKGPAALRKLKPGEQPQQIETDDDAARAPGRTDAAPDTRDEPGPDG